MKLATFVWTVVLGLGLIWAAPAINVSFDEVTPSKRIVSEKVLPD